MHNVDTVFMEAERLGHPVPVTRALERRSRLPKCLRWLQDHMLTLHTKGTGRGGTDCTVIDADSELMHSTVIAVAL